MTIFPILKKRKPLPIPPLTGRGNRSNVSAPNRRKDFYGSQETSAPNRREDFYGSQETSAPNRRLDFSGSQETSAPTRPGLGNWNLALGTFMLVLGALFTSCSMVNEDMPDCPHTFVLVNFEYKYHMSSEYVTTEDDWFGDHAGSAYLYVFDENGTYLFFQQRNKAFLDKRNPDFSILLDETQVEPGKSYIFAAMAQGNHAGYEASLLTPGFTLLKEMEPNVSKLEDFRVKLDRNDDGIYDLGVTDDTGFFNWKDSYADNNLKLDTLWSTRKTKDQDFLEYVTVPTRNFYDKSETMDDVVKEVTMQMMRITNSIKVNLVCDMFDQETDVNDYKFLIDFPKGNGTLGFTGDLDSEISQELQYYTLRKNVQQYQYKQPNAQYDADGVDYSDLNHSSSNLGTRAATYCVNAEFGVSRLQTFDESFLQILNAQTGREIARIDNLSDWLASYFDHRYDDQEFLDREYDFTIDVHIDDAGNPIMIQAGCYILGWGRRIQDVTLGK